MFKKALARWTETDDPENDAIVIDYSNYSVELVRLFADMLYGVNKKKLNINDILQLMTFVVGEGRYYLLNNKIKFIYFIKFTLF